MVTVGIGKNRAPNQLPPWTSNRFAVFLERDPAGFSTNLKLLDEGRSPLRGQGGPANKQRPGTTYPESEALNRRDQQEAAIFWIRPRQDARSLVRSIASLEVRFFFDIRTNGSIARRKDAPGRTRGTHAGGCPDVDRRDWIVPLPAQAAVLLLSCSVVCRGRSRPT